MKLKLAIIHLDMVVKTIELEPGEYTVGRSSENNIVVQHFSLEPQHGKIYFEEGWYYKSNGPSEPVSISHDQTLNLSDQVALATQDYVESGQTHISDFSVLHSARKEVLNQRLVVVLGLVTTLLLIVVLGYQTFKSSTPRVQQSHLITKVRDKIVEFESVRHPKPIEELKTYAGLTDADFKDKAGFCTGFLVGPNIVLTAAHCLFGRFVIDINNDFYLKAADGKQFKIKEVLGFDVKRDFLYLKTEGMEEYGHLEFAPKYEIEQKVYTVGNVHGEGIAIRDGIISSETTDPDEPDVKFLRYSAGTSPGNSGGPLLNENGDVVALVFAATNSENFNLGTPSDYLVKAYDNFVQDEEKKTINLALKRVLNFKAAVLLQALALPYLPQFDEYPEISQAFDEVAVEVEVPIDFDSVDKEILEPVNAKFIETFNTVQGILAEKKEIVLDWKSFVSKKTPAILPSQFDSSQSVFTKIKDRYYPHLAGLIDSPSKSDFTKYVEQLKKEKKFDFQAYGYNVEVTQEKVDLLESDVFYKPKDVSGKLPRVQSLSFGAPYSQLLLIDKDDVRTKDFFGIKLFLKNYLGKQGTIFNTASRFIRPNSVKDFTIKDFQIKTEDIQVEQVEDRLGRKWRREKIKVFESLNIYTYCKDMPEGVICIARVLNVYNEFLLDLIENNFRKYILSHLLINPYFWNVDALTAYLANGHAKGSPLMDGVTIKKSNGEVEVTLKEFPVKYKIKDANNVESIRVQTGLVHKDKKALWTGYGTQWVQRKADKDLLCGAGVEIFKSQSAFILNFLRDRRKQEKLRKIKGEDPKPLPGIWYKPFRGLPVPFQLFGYCAPLQEDPRIAGQYFVDFKNAKPYKLNYSIR